MKTRRTGHQYEMKLMPCTTKMPMWKESATKAVRREAAGEISASGDRHSKRSPETAMPTHRAGVVMMVRRRPPRQPSVEEGRDQSAAKMRGAAAARKCLLLFRHLLHLARQQLLVLRDLLHLVRQQRLMRWLLVLQRRHLLLEDPICAKRRLESLDDRRLFVAPACELAVLHSSRSWRS